jgi:putative hydrolase of the HAD superfamily
MSVTTIVFDFGNVLGLFDRRKAAEQLRAYGGASTEAILLHLAADPLEVEFEAGKLPAAAYVRLMCGKFGLACGDEEFGLAYADMFTPNEDVCRLVPGLAQGHRLLLLSNTNELHSRHFRRQFAEVLSPFAGLVLSHEVGLRKPDPGVYRHCEQLAGAPPEQCLLIDDLRANLEGARGRGWATLLYRPGDDLQRQLAAHGVDVEGAPTPRRRAPSGGTNA